MSQNPDAAPEFDPNEVWTVKQFTSARSASKFYQVLALLTGAMLMVLTVEMAYKYLIAPFALGIPAAEALNFFPYFDLASAIAITHGWCYVVYLISCFWLNQAMRWRIPRLIVLALAGVIPVMSFILERRIMRQVDEELDAAVVVAPKA